MQQITLQNPEGLQPTTKCKLYIQYGLTRNITLGGKTDLHHGVQLKNISKVLKKRNQENIKRVIVIAGSKQSRNERDRQTFVLYKAPELL